MSDIIDYTKRLVTMSRDDCLRVLRALHTESDPAAIVDFSDEIDSITALQKQVAAEAARIRAWLSDSVPMSEPADPGTAAAVAYGDADLGTRCIVSGGEVVELDAYLEARYEDRYDEELPF